MHCTCEIDREVSSTSFFWLTRTLFAVLPVLSLLHSNFTFDPVSVDELGVCGEDDEYVDPFSW
jgi:hypothetical protein